MEGIEPSIFVLVKFSYFVDMNKSEVMPLLVAESILPFVVLIALPIFAAWRANSRNDLPENCAR